MKKKHIIKLAHPMREMLAEIVLGLDDFELADESKPMILSNRKKADIPGHSANAILDRLRSFVSRTIILVQRRIGLINFKIVLRRDCDILVAHGGFLITNRPYVTYVEKATQLYGYTAKNYNKKLSLFMLRRFLRSNLLKSIFFLSRAAFDGMMNIEFFDDEIRGLIRSKGVVIYPPVGRSEEADVERFKDVNDGFRFLYISNNFYGKGGLELLHAFNRLWEKTRNTRLVIVTNVASIEESDLQDILKNSGIELHDFIFTREELFRKFFDTCHVLCYPTYSDSFSSVVNEAICSYLPIVTTDFYAIPERVVDGFNGFLCRSPFVNYSKDFVIHSEHFTDQPDFHEIIRSARGSGRLQYIEDFLYEKMKLFSVDTKILYQMALNSKRTYNEKVNSDVIRREINGIFSSVVQ